METAAETSGAESAALDQRVVAAARKLIQNARFAEAERQLKRFLASLDSNNEADDVVLEALYTLAVAQRYGRKLPEALATLDELIGLNQDFARAYQERGHGLLSENRLTAARESYEEAVQRNPALIASWKALINLYEIAGMRAQSAVAEQRVAYLESLPRELQSVSTYLHDGRLQRADRLCRHFLQTRKTHIEGMRLLATIREKLEMFGEAEFLLTTALELEPDNESCRSDLANLLLKMQKFDQAHEQTARLSEDYPENLAYLSMHANAKAGIGEQEQAIELYNQVISQSRGQHRLHLLRGHAEKTIGKLDAAVASYREAYRLAPDYGDAFWSLANTKTYEFMDKELLQMQEREASRETGLDDRIHLCFALGKAFEDRSEFEKSFGFYERGNSLKQDSVKHDPENLSKRLGAQKVVLTEKFFQKREGVGCDAADPIFIVGLPRAGSTLLEQILASHSKVDGTLELPNMIALANRLDRGKLQAEGVGYPRVLETLDYDYFRRFGEQFIEDTRVHRQDAPLFIDKNPNNFAHVGLIKLILPNAKVIDARRHPLSCCFSGFKQLFGQGHEFSYGLRQIGNYYSEYVDLMAHWNQVLPGFVHLVGHEDVVDALEFEVRRMLDFCELEFEPACLEYYKTERSIRTPSSEQVRQPIYRDALEAWKPYEPWLDPLKEALGPKVREMYGIL